MSDEVFKDAFNLLCGDLIGEGLHRKVYECKIRDDLVVKVEGDDVRYFANVFEQGFWDLNQYDKKVAAWLAPCEYLSPDGRLLLQKKASPIRASELPDKIPCFLTDIKIGNFGIIDGKIVCVDYAIHILNPSMRMVKAHWD